MLTKMHINSSLVWAHLKDRDEGATAAEYGLLVALIAVAIIIAVTALGGTLSSTFQNVSDTIGGGTPTTVAGP